MGQRIYHANAPPPPAFCNPVKKILILASSHLALGPGKTFSDPVIKTISIMIFFLFVILVNQTIKVFLDEGVRVVSARDAPVPVQNWRLDTSRTGYQVRLVPSATGCPVRLGAQSDWVYHEADWVYHEADWVYHEGTYK